MLKLAAKSLRAGPYTRRFSSETQAASFPWLWAKRGISIHTRQRPRLMTERQQPDQPNVPSERVDCAYLHRHGRAEYVVAHRGVWGIAPGQDVPNEDDENAIFVYIQMVKSVFTNGTPPFDSGEIHIPARYWCELMAEFQPEAILPMFLNSAECRDYINDRLVRVWNRPDLTPTLSKNAPTSFRESGTSM